MALDSDASFVNTDGSAYPDNKAVNASGPTAVDGTEFVKIMVDNYMFGPQQALLNYAGLTPDGLPEADGTSQEIEAMKKSFGFPGESVNWYGENDPAVEGAKILLLHGQGVLVASYLDLVAAVYVGDGDNATAPAFYKADDAGGTIRSIAGIYLILPDARKVYPKFIPTPEYTARIQNNGAASILSESEPFIDSVSRVSVGRVEVNLTAGVFGFVPSATGNIISGGSETRLLTILSATTAKIETSSEQASGPDTDHDFTIKLSRQDTDANPFGDGFLEPGIRY